MPKAEKQLRKDVTSLQQEVKRKRQDPGSPSDTGIWEGAVESKSRGPAHICSAYALNFLKSALPLKVAGFAFSHLKGIAISVENIKLSFNSTTLQLQEKIHFPTRPKHVFQFFFLQSETLKSMKKRFSNSLGLQDSVSTQLNP